MEDGVHGESEKVVHERVQGRGGEADSEQRQERRRRVARAWADRDERRAWVKRAEIDERKDPQGPLTSEERGENTRLRRELKTGANEADLLPKTAAVLA